MNNDSELRIKYLHQVKEIYGDKIYLEPILKEIPNLSKNNLDIFCKSISDCQKCSLGLNRTNFVFGVGNPNADIVFVGEAPGENEDLVGKPFVGRAGKLLDKILAAIELSRDDVYICNILKCRPPNNRDPLPSEVELCEPYLKTQISLINPKLIVALGRVSACTILKKDEQLKNMRNKVFNYAGIDLLVTYHPAALLRNPNLKKPAWEDFQFIQANYIISK